MISTVRIRYNDKYCEVNKNSIKVLMNQPSVGSIVGKPQSE